MTNAFPHIQEIRYEGPQSKKALSFRYYNESEVVAGKTMKDRLRFSVAYWHTMRHGGADAFGPGTILRPWETGVDYVEMAQERGRVAVDNAKQIGLKGRLHVEPKSKDPTKRQFECALAAYINSPRDYGPALPALSIAHSIPPNPQLVFLVHGRARMVAESIARFVEKLGPKVVILQEQPNAGRTVIEKFQDHAAVAYAIVLVTGDDRGRLKHAAASEEEKRARQNVILELGYFIGRIGRNRVLVIREDGVELPSDLTGVICVPLDASGAWQVDTARELHAAGLAVDLNKAIFCETP